MGVLETHTEKYIALCVLYKSFWRFLRILALKAWGTDFSFSDLDCICGGPRLTSKIVPCCLINLAGSCLLWFGKLIPCIKTWLSCVFLELLAPEILKILLCLPCGWATSLLVTHPLWQSAHVISDWMSGQMMQHILFYHFCCVVPPKTSCLE